MRKKNDGNDEVEELQCSNDEKKESDDDSSIFSSRSSNSEANASDDEMTKEAEEIKARAGG